MEKDPVKTQEQTIAAIEKGLEDIKKGQATKVEVLQLIDERKKLDEAALAAANAEIKTLKSGAEEFKTQATEFASKLQQIRSNNFASLKSPDGSYKGLFANHLEAKAFGLMIMAAASAGSAKLQKSHDDCKKALEDMGTKMKWLNPDGSKTMTGSSQAGGSALVTVEMIPSLIRLFENYGVFEADALPIPMGTGQTLQPKTDTILDLQCPGEGVATTSQNITIALISHLAKTYTALTAYSIELDEDSAIPLGELMAYIFSRSYGYGIDKMAFLGDGTSTYLGTLGIAGKLRAVDATIANIKSLVVGAGNAYGELLLANFTSVVGTLPDMADDGNANWYVHRYFYYTVMVALALAAGGTQYNEVLMSQGARKKLFLGYDVRFTQVMPKTAANNQICALLANLKLGAQLGRRGVLEISQSSEAYFAQRLIAVLAARRLSINIHGVGDTTNAGPICGLITAAS